jgi:5'-nucleotidase
MNVLLTNDDGINAKGIQFLAKELSKVHNVLIVAPKQNCSGFSQSLTVRKPIVIEEVELSINARAFGISGTPTDCVKIAHHLFNDFKIDVVISGINDGFNIGTDVFYSGTVGAASQAGLLGYKSIAISFPYATEYFDEFGKMALTLIDEVFSLPSAVWNINFPDVKPNEIKGKRFAKVGDVKYTDRYEKCQENNSYKLEGELLYNPNGPEDCDACLLEAGYITISPISIERTDISTLNEVLKCRL